MLAYKSIAISKITKKFIVDIMKHRFIIGAGGSQFTLFLLALSLLFLSFINSSIHKRDSEVHPENAGSTSPLEEGVLIRTEPAFPTKLDDITVYFDAREGNGALAGFTGNVYAHTGVITNFSTGPSDWKYVVADWATDDPKVLMNRESQDIYTISYNIQEFYGLAPGEEVLQLAFVFRNIDGTIVGRDTDGSDIFTPVFPLDAGILITLNSPQEEEIIFEGESLQVDVQLNETANLIIEDNGQELFNAVTDQADFVISPETSGEHNLLITAFNETDTTTLTTRYFVIEANPVLQDPPEGTRNGMNYNDESYIFQLHAPGKNNVFFLCPANGFQFEEEFLMNQSLDGSRFWIELPRSVFAEGNNTYQYLVDGNITIADPYSTVVLDPVHDEFVDRRVLEELPSYPEGASGVVTVFDLEKEGYNWENEDFLRPAKTDLVIYELLIRDFLEDHSYQSLIDTLDYLERLGINAIELMPIHEFEGNISWGYNPSYHLAVDKYYGSRNELKQFIDEAHGRGIAVILDVVFNHAFSQSPLVQLYWNPVNSRPSADNPWFNTTPRHPFNVGYDFNHEYEGTRQWVKRNLEQWIEEYHFDGFRFDLSKGLTQNFTGNDAGAFSRYDAARVAILKDYTDYIWSLDPTAYVIMEHFADNREERELSDYGMMLWGNMNFQFAEAAMGYNSDLDGADYTDRGWTDPHLISYMESHDEERLMFKIQEFGNSRPGYNTQELNTALRRKEAASAIYYSIPGPKMLWQFGELGYDFSINYCTNGTVNPDCRLELRPIRWDYKSNSNRARLRDVTEALIRLKITYPTFSTTDFQLDDNDPFKKRVVLNHPEMDALAIANFNVDPTEINPGFQSTGTWYEYFTGDSILVDNVNQPLPFQPGEYRIYTSARITPATNIITSTKERVFLPFELYPNPVKAGQKAVVEFEPVAGNFENLAIYTLQGKAFPVQYNKKGTRIELTVPEQLSAGVYLLIGQTKARRFSGKLIIQ